MRRIGALAVYVALLSATTIARVVPVRVSYPLARAAGLAVYLAWPGGRRRSQRNMWHVTGGNAALARRYARQSFEYYGTYIIDFLRFGSLARAELDAAVDFDDWSRIEEQRTGHGILFVTMHFGNWDLAGAVIAQRMPMTVIADTFGNEAVNRLVVGARRRLGMNVLPAERTSTEVLRALRRNDVVAALADIPRPEAGIRVDFFGSPVAIPEGLARIALRTGAPIMVGGVWRRGPRAEVYDAQVEVVEFQATGEREQDVLALTQAMMHALERLVLRAPQQWYIFRHLWIEDSTGARGGGG